MTNIKIQEQVDQIVTLIEIVEMMQGVRLQGYFLETAKWLRMIAEQDYVAVYDCIVALKARIAIPVGEADIFQMFDKIERDLLKVMVMLEHDQQARMSQVVISAYNRVGRWTSDFEKAVNSFHYEYKERDLNKIVQENKDNPFLGSDMVNSIIQLIINSNYRVISLDKLILK